MGKDKIIEELGGNFKILTGNGETDIKEALADNIEILGVYFSAHWCPPCRGFTPKLVEVYNELKQQKGEFEVLFVSSDRDADSFNEYYGEMPWKALPFGDDMKGKLCDKYGIRGIPTLILINKDGIVSQNGRAKAMDVKSFPWELEEGQKTT